MSTGENRIRIRKYPIGTFARMAGVSTHFLKFYEEKGILHPVVQDNGYRTYDIRDASFVLECRRMKNMGLSVKEIEKAINDSTPAETEQLLAQQQNVLEEQLWQQQMHLQGLQNLRAALRFCQQQEWSVRTAPDIWFLAHTMDQEFLQEEGIYRQLPQWLEWMPLVTSAQMITALPEGRLRAEWGLGVEVQQAQQIRLAPDAPARLVQQGRVLEIWVLAGDGERAERSADVPHLHGPCRRSEPDPGAYGVSHRVLLHRKGRAAPDALYAAGGGKSSPVKPRGCCTSPNKKTRVI